ncbi:octopamine receptor beta-2R [Hydra vulgaris]|uniref:octopamine receptor beta-2R n=1 Tax=Hydra vulgaris TaxID=6087 RepID=UPI0006417555|nr:octopamine receptor beta-2R [Hydra vulgaris]XP_047145582.1 octopamine receptor beta-2R [Hydra vulgaris]XP_047145583.1 octopamine receptor beta-2R [Hydra vulgaris]
MNNSTTINQSVNQTQGCELPNNSLVWLDLCLFLTISIVATIGNIVVFICYYKFQSLHTVTNVFMLSLSASDLFVALFSIPLSISFFICNHLHNELYYVGDMTPSVLSIYSLALVAVDRAIAIALPYYHQEKVSRKTAWVAVGITWLLMFSYTLIGMNFHATSSNQFTVSVVFITYGFPVTVMVLSYVIMGVVAKKHAKELNKLDKTMNRFQNDNLSKKKNADLIINENLNKKGKNQPTDNQELVRHSTKNKIFKSNSLNTTRHLRRELKAALTLSLILSCFIISWTPFMSLNVVSLFTSPNKILLKYFKILHYINSALNPILYVVLNQRWRKSFKKVLCKWRENKNLRFVHSISETVNTNAKPSGW